MKQIITTGLLALTLLITGFTAASANTGITHISAQEPAETLYNAAYSLLGQREFNAAAIQFAEIERQYPESKWASKAQLMQAYARYEAKEYDHSIRIVDQYLNTHSDGEDLAYATYLRALNDYDRAASLKQDKAIAHNALKGMQDVVDRFPDTTYAKDAVVKIATISGQLATQP